jgi:hypothetical protein
VTPHKRNSLLVKPNGSSHITVVDFRLRKPIASSNSQLQTKHLSEHSLQTIQQQFNIDMTGI